MGRKKKYNSETVWISIPMTKEQKEAIEQRASELNLSISDFIKYSIGASWEKKGWCPGRESNPHG